MSEILKEWQMAEYFMPNNLAVSTLDDEQLRKIVRRVLKSWKDLDDEGLKEVILEYCEEFLDPPKGFKNMKKVLQIQSQMLEKQIMDRIHDSEKVAMLFASFWSAMYEELSERMHKTLVGKPTLHSELVRIRKRYGKGSPDDFHWKLTCQKFAELEAFPDDLELIDTMLSIRIGIQDSLPLGEWYESLERLAFDDQLWGERLQRFCADIQELNQQKEEQGKEINTQNQVIENLIKEYRKELEYLELHIPNLTGENPKLNLSVVKQALARMEKTLERYSKVYRRRDSNRTQIELEEHVEKLKNARQTVCDAYEKLNGAINPFVFDWSHFDWHDLSDSGESEQELREKAESYKRQLAELTNELEQTKTLNQELIRKNEKAKEEADAARSEVRVLKTELHQKEQYDALLKSTGAVHLNADSATNGGAEQVQIESVRHAIETATNAFGLELTVKLNRNSEWKNSRFEKPKQVYDALRWLAGSYRTARMNGSGCSPKDLGESIRQELGWFYIPGQREVTIQKHPGWYQTQIDDQKFILEEHIGVGKTSDKKYTMRIAFAWDQENRKVVIGYVGSHQPTH